MIDLVLLAATEPQRAEFITTLALLVVAFVLSQLLAPKPEIENQKPAGLGAFDFPTATEGRPIPIVFGTVQIAGPNVVWYGDFEQEAITQEVKTGMFSSEEQTIGFRYHVGIQFALCIGPIDAVTKVWVGDESVWSGDAGHHDDIVIDEPDFFGGDDLGSGGLEATLRVHAGLPTQGASNYLSDFQDISGKTPAYPNIAYLAPKDDAFYIGNQPRLQPWKFAVRRIPLGPATGADQEVGGGNRDANPVNVLYEVLTNKHWGMGFDPATIDTANFAAVGTTLADEINGFAFLLDRTMEMVDFIRLVEEQIDGVLYKDSVDGLWRINLMRDDYDPETIVAITNPDDVIEMKSFSRGGWSETKNEVRAEFVRRGKGYKQTYAPAQDMANVRIQDGTVLTAAKRYPGVMRRKLANAIAWRELRLLSYPLAKAEVVVDRQFVVGSDRLVPGTPILYVDSNLEVSLVMRVRNINSGELEDGRVTLELIQDVFRFADGQFADPPEDNDWEEPTDDLAAIPTDEQLAFEVPRGLELRDPQGSGVPLDRVWCAARRQGPEVSFKVVARSAAGTPSGSFAEVGESFGFVLIGELKNDLDAGSGVPHATLDIVADPDTQIRLEEVFDDAATAQDVGIDLQHLLLVDDEFMAPLSAAFEGVDVRLTSTYRGLLDSAQADHAAGAKVYLLFRGGIPVGPFTQGWNVDVKLLPRSQSDLVAEGDATTIALQMDDRIRRPYCPSRVSLNGTPFDGTPSLEGTGSDAEDFGIILDLVRRDYRVAQDEVAALTTDAEDLFPDFPAANQTEHEIEVRNDPSGTNTLLFLLGPGDGPTFTALRMDILIATGGAVPTELAVVARARHSHELSIYESLQDLAFAFAPTTALTGQFEFGALDNGDVSALYTATVAGTYGFTLSSAFTSGDVEYRLNGGSWTTLITAGGTSGSIVGVSVSDTIEVRHLSTDTTAKKQLDMAAAGAGQDGFAVLFT